MNINSQDESLRVYFLSDISNKKKLFERLAELLAEDSELSFEKILDSLTCRERMGSTCIGHGVAIPHSKLDIESPVGVLLILEEAISCSNKQADVSVIFGLLIPDDQAEKHLALLNNIAATCREGDWLDQLKAIKDEAQLRAFIMNSNLDMEPFCREINHS